MTLTQSVVDRAPHPSGLYDVIDLILDKGLVIDAYVRVSLVGIELLTIDARIVVASVDTYLRFAEAVGRLQIPKEDPKADLPDMAEKLTEGGSKGKASGALSAVKETLSGGGGDEEDKEPARREDEDERDDDDG